MEKSEFEKKKEDLDKKKRDEEEDARWLVFLDNRVRKTGKRLLQAWMLAATLGNPGKRLKLQGDTAQLDSLEVAGSFMTKTDIESSNPDDENSSSPQVDGLDRGSMLARTFVEEIRTTPTKRDSSNLLKLTGAKTDQTSPKIQGKLKVRGGRRGEGS